MLFLARFLREFKKFMDPKFWLKVLILINCVHIDFSIWHHDITLISLFVISCYFQFLFCFESVSCLGTSKNLSLGCDEYIKYSLQP